MSKVEETSKINGEMEQEVCKNQTSTCRLCFKLFLFTEEFQVLNWNVWKDILKMYELNLKSE